MILLSGCVRVIFNSGGGGFCYFVVVFESLFAYRVLSVRFGALNYAGTWDQQTNYYVKMLDLIRLWIKEWMMIGTHDDGIRKEYQNSGIGQRRVPLSNAILWASEGLGLLINYDATSSSKSGFVA